MAVLEYVAEGGCTPAYAAIYADQLASLEAAGLVAHDGAKYTVTDLHSVRRLRVARASGVMRRVATGRNSP